MVSEVPVHSIITDTSYFGDCGKAAHHEDSVWYSKTTHLMAKKQKKEEEEETRQFPNN
jgi:hypothetical protein